MKGLVAFLARNPWVFVVLGFALLIGAWATFLVLASKHPPQRIEVKKHF